MNNRIGIWMVCGLLAGVVTQARGADAPKQLANGLYARITTGKGPILIRLELEKAPMTVANFVGLAEGTKDSSRGKGIRYYDGLIFHRVIANFMIQGGCPKGNGSGGPGYKFPNEIHADLKHSKAGTVAMANAGPDTNGSQFYITHGPTPHLDGGYNVFGYVMKGMDAVNAIGVGDKIEKVEIVRVGAKAEVFKVDQAFFERAIVEAKARKLANDPNEKLIREKWPNAKTTPSGLRYVITKPGVGRKPKRGMKVKVHYTGTLLDGTEFDSSRKSGRPPFEFDVGTGRVIQGWHIGVGDMKKGERRILIIPHELAYGPRGRPPVIPPSATLVFDVELLDF